MTSILDTMKGDQIPSGIVVAADQSMHEASNCAALGLHTHRVVTWQSPSGATLDVCTACATRLEAAHSWPRTESGEEYCQVSHGEHRGTCELEE